VPKVENACIDQFLALQEPISASPCRWVGTVSGEGRWDCPELIAYAQRLRAYIRGGEKLRTAVEWGSRHGIHWRGESLEEYRALVDHISRHKEVRRREGESSRDYGKRMLQWCKDHGGPAMPLPYDPSQSLSGDPVVSR